jgi:hypothetical protein
VLNTAPSQCWSLLWVLHTYDDHAFPILSITNSLRPHNLVLSLVRSSSLSSYRNVRSLCFLYLKSYPQSRTFLALLYDRQPTWGRRDGRSTYDSVYLNITCSMTPRLMGHITVLFTTTSIVHGFRLRPSISARRVFQLAEPQTPTTRHAPWLRWVGWKSWSRAHHIMLFLCCSEIFTRPFYLFPALLVADIRFTPHGCSAQNGVGRCSLTV